MERSQVGQRKGLIAEETSVKCIIVTPEKEYSDMARELVWW